LAVKRATGIMDMESMELMRRMVLVTGDWSIVEPRVVRGNLLLSIWAYSATDIPLQRMVDAASDNDCG
jgi:hypothetical protein